MQLCHTYSALERGLTGANLRPPRYRISGLAGHIGSSAPESAPRMAWSRDNAPAPQLRGGRASVPRAQRAKKRAYRRQSATTMPLNRRWGRLPLSRAFVLLCLRAPGGGGPGVPAPSHVSDFAALHVQGFQGFGLKTARDQHMVRQQEGNGLKNGLHAR